MFCSERNGSFHVHYIIHLSDVALAAMDMHYFWRTPRRICNHLGCAYFLSQSKGYQSQVSLGDSLHPRNRYYSPASSEDLNNLNCVVAVGHSNHLAGCDNNYRPQNGLRHIILRNWHHSNRFIPFDTAENLFWFIFPKLNDRLNKSVLPRTFEYRSSTNPADTTRVRLLV